MIFMNSVLFRNEYFLHEGINDVALSDEYPILNSKLIPICPNLCSEVSATNERMNKAFLIVEKLSF